MAVLTDAEKAALEARKYIVLRTNVGHHLRGQVISGKQLGVENVERLLWGKHIREAGDFEASMSKVTLDDDAEGHHLSYEHKMSVLEKENQSLRRQLLSERERCELLESQARPRQAGANEQATMALLQAKERKAAEAEGALNQARQERDDLRRDNEALLARVVAMQESAGRNEPPPKPAEEEPAPRDTHIQAGPGDQRPIPPGRKPR
jgi:hypothetical protein